MATLRKQDHPEIALLERLSHFDLFVVIRRGRDIHHPSQERLDVTPRLVGFHARERPDVCSPTRRDTSLYQLHDRGLTSGGSSELSIQHRRHRFHEDRSVWEPRDEVRPLAAGKSLWFALYRGTQLLQRASHHQLEKAVAVVLLLVQMVVDAFAASHR